jgi:hypothetical protein
MKKVIKENERRVFTYDVIGYYGTKFYIIAQTKGMEELTVYAQ